MAELKKKAIVLMLVGGSAKDRDEFCHTVLSPEYEWISFPVLGEAVAKDMFSDCLRERKSCVLDGDFSDPEFRSQFIADACAACARVVAFDFDHERIIEARHMENLVGGKHIASHPVGEAPSLEEGFDEINSVKRIDGVLRFRLFEKRCPMREFRKDENGNTIEVELGREYYTIDRPGSNGCLMSIEALKELITHKP